MNTYKILLIDDDTDIRRTIVEYLQGSDLGKLEVLIAADPESGIDRAKTEKPNIILLDWDFKSTYKDGITILKELKADEITKNIPVIMLTYSDLDETIKEAFNAGAVDYIIKPSTPANMIARIKAIQRTYEYISHLENMIDRTFPKEIADVLRKGEEVKSMSYSYTNVMSIDFKDFFLLTKSLSADSLIAKLEFYFSEFDRIIDKFKLQKIKTSGDTYICANGLYTTPENKNNINLKYNITKQAIDIILAGREVQKLMQKNNGNGWKCNIGISSGNAIVSVLKQRGYHYDIWGEAAIIAKQIEKNSEQAGSLVISDKTYELVKDFFKCIYKKTINIKGHEIKIYDVVKINLFLSKEQEGEYPDEKAFKTKLEQMFFVKKINTITPEQKHELEQLLNLAKIPDFFSKIDNYLQEHTLEELKLEYIYGKTDYKFIDRLKVYINKKLKES
jgi:DNA-binding response OmpR family regulator